MCDHESQCDARPVQIRYQHDPTADQSAKQIVRVDIAGENQN